MCHCKIPAVQRNAQCAFRFLKVTTSRSSHICLAGLHYSSSSSQTKGLSKVEQWPSPVTLFLFYRLNKERLEGKGAQSLGELNDLVIYQSHLIQGCHQPCCLSQSCLPLDQCCRHFTRFTTKLCLWMKQLVCTFIFNFLLLMALPIASALLIITHRSLLLSMLMWLSQVLLSLSVLAVCSEAESCKQLLCLLDLVLKKVKRATAHQLSRGQALS